VTNDDLAAAVHRDAEQHAPRTPARRAARALHTALITTSTTDAARRALGTVDPAIRADALKLLGRLADEHASSTKETSR
jgi:hypothetical protein